MDRTPYARAAARVCAAWGLTEAEGAALLRGDPERAHLVLGISALLADLYAPPLPAQWMTIPNRNPAIGGSDAAPVRPVDHVINTENGLVEVWNLLRGYAQGK